MLPSLNPSPPLPPPSAVALNAAGPPGPVAAVSGDAAAPAPGGPFYLPDGTPLMLSLAVKIWMGRIFGEEGTDVYHGLENSTQDLTLLYLAAHPPEVWLAPGVEDGRTLPLVQRPIAFQLAVVHFAERLGTMTLRALGELAAALWNGEHATQVHPKKKAEPEAETTTTTASSPTGASSI